MKAGWFIAVTLAAGAAAGVFFGLINLALVEPFIDRAIGYEEQAEMQAGHAIDPGQLADYRNWQKTGEVASAVIFGMALAAVFGIIFAYTRGALPGRNNVRKALALAGIMWFVVFFVTALKYPPNPPAVDASGSIYYRQLLYVSFLLISGFGALASIIIARRLQRTRQVKPVMIFPPMYAGIVAAAYFALPPSGYQVPEIMTGLVFDFRIVSELTLAMYWGAMGLIFGLLWERSKRHLESDQRLTTV
jgi:Probable cobalt transporter subunit (CbtA)